MESTTDNYRIDHGLSDNAESPDTSTDPEGVERREERPPTNNHYVNDMMAFNARTKRWEPSESFVLQKARDVREAHKAFCERQKPLTQKEKTQALGLLTQATSKLESGPFNGLLYGIKDMILKHMASTFLWMENSEAIRVSMLQQGQDPAGENVTRSADAIEKNRVALGYFSNILRAIQEEYDDQISLTDFAWINAAKQASWDLLGYYKRIANDPQKRQSDRVQRRQGEDLLFG